MNGATTRAPDLVVWGVPIAVLLHNVEEGLTFARYAPRVRELVPAAARHLVPDPRTMYLALVVATAIPIALSLLARRPRSARWATYGLLLVAGVFLVNVGWHLAATVVLGGYAPGVATAVAINLPVTIGTLRRARAETWLSARGLWALLGISLAAHVAPALVAGAALVVWPWW